eukprot:scaffold254_cov160-Skeletonema_dohrnii-CCMP3373.AAC.1
MTTGTTVDDIDIAQHSHDSTGTGGADQRVSTRDGSRANTDIVMRSSETHTVRWMCVTAQEQAERAWAEHYTGVETEMRKRRDGNGRGKDQAKFGLAKTEMN